MFKETRELKPSFIYDLGIAITHSGVYPIGWYAFVVEPRQARHTNIQQLLRVEPLDEQKRVKAMFEYAPYRPPAETPGFMPLEMATFLNEIVSTRPVHEFCRKLNGQRAFRRRWLEKALEPFDHVSSVGKKHNTPAKFCSAVYMFALSIRDELIALGDNSIAHAAVMIFRD
ncbi:hypothetical protein F5B17DRAFT_431631 [Nemania serpens]|nr:hypothetical protein F5B17DRAFT_431631 [Nemania serpens]